MGVVLIAKLAFGLSRSTGNLAGVVCGMA